MGNAVQVTVNGRLYFVQRFNPMDAYRFYAAWGTSRDKPKHDYTLGLAALRRCCAPSGESLEPVDAMNSHFSNYPEDMIPLSYAAQSVLIEEFKIELERYLKANQLLMQQLRKRPQKLKVPPGWECESFFGRIVVAGLCRYGELRSGDISIPTVFEMFRLLDWKDYCTSVALERAEANKPKVMR